MICLDALNDDFISMAFRQSIWPPMTGFDSASVLSRWASRSDPLLGGLLLISCETSTMDLNCDRCKYNFDGSVKLAS